MVAGNSAVYAMSKAAIMPFTRSLALGLQTSPFG